MKIKDLTEEQIHKICKKQKTCISCPLFFAKYRPSYFESATDIICVKNLQDYLDKEVEV